MMYVKLFNKVNICYLFHLSPYLRKLFSNMLLFLKYTDKACHRVKHCSLYHCHLTVTLSMAGPKFDNFIWNV